MAEVPWLWPIQKDVEPFPTVMRAPLSVRKEVQWTSDEPGDPSLADQIFDANMPQVRQFVFSQQQVYGLGGARFHSRSLALPRLDVRYVNNFGREEVFLRAYPEAVGGGEEAKRQEFDAVSDGYILITGGSFTYDIRPTVMHIKLNGTDLEDFTLDNPPVNAWNAHLITFGKEVFRCHSQNDALNPNKLLSEVKPKRADHAAFFYYPFGFPNPFLHPQNTDILYPEGYPAYDGMVPAILSRQDFPDIPSSPLDPKGLNTLTFEIDPAPPPGSLASTTATGLILAEFYSRDPKDLRPVIQSWHYPPRPLVELLINDRPRQYRNPFQIMKIDLPPGFSYPILPPGNVGRGIDYNRALLGDFTVIDRPYLLDLSANAKARDYWAGGGEDCIPPQYVT